MVYGVVAIDPFTDGKQKGEGMHDVRVGQANRRILLANGRRKKIQNFPLQGMLKRKNEDLRFQKTSCGKSLARLAEIFP
jgi:hypothetical protein